MAGRTWSGPGPPWALGLRGVPARRPPRTSAGLHVSPPARAARSGRRAEQLGPVGTRPTASDERAVAGRTWSGPGPPWALRFRGVPARRPARTGNPHGHPAQAAAPNNWVQ
ncbi:hypothetical protein GCM10009544_27040 [Streptomyces stramineus]|uniref:Uncharacterized protein n=1 Tax=Streptomyces stramineus TaxID=173861 RepID=A0ABP3JSV2_9ACTN